MKIELEIDEHLARRLAARDGCWVEEVKEDVVEQAAKACLSIYGGFPDLVTQRHLSALAIVRAQAAEQASRCITDKYDSSVTNAASSLLDFMLSRQ